MQSETKKSINQKNQLIHKKGFICLFNAYQEQELKTLIATLQFSQKSEDAQNRIPNI